MNPKVTMGLRIVLGLFVLFFGVNKFANFMGFPEMGEEATTLMTIYGTSGFMKIIGILEILGGLALITGKFVPLAATFMVAIMLNAAIFHGLHDPANIGGAILGLLLSLGVVYAYKDKFKDLLSA